MTVKNIALLLGDVRDVYSNAVSKGAMQAAMENDCNLLIVPGRYYQAREEMLLGEYEYQYQTLFSYFRDHNVDLIILAAGSVGYVSGSGERNSLDNFRTQIGDIPFLTISGDAKGVPNVRYDNYTGLMEGVRYLIEKQHCLNLAMVGGNRDNPDTIERVDAFRKALLENGLTPDESRIIYGEFTERSKDAVYEFLKQHPDTDGIVFANDRMAIGSYEAARRLGLTVGRDIAFLGFDNIEKDNYLDPPLASVDADAIGLGYSAVIEALKYVNTGEFPDRVIPSRFVLRNSVNLEGEQEIFRQALGYGLEDELDFETMAKDSFTYIYQPKNDEEGKTNLYESYRRFLLDLYAIVYATAPTQMQVDVLRFSYNQLFEEDVRGDIDLSRLTVVLEAFEKMMLNECPGYTKEETVKRMSSYFFKHLNALISLRESNTSYRLKKIQHEIYRISVDMVGFHNISDKTYASLLTNFDRVGIRHCFLFLFDNPVRNEFTDEYLPDKELYLKAVLKNGELSTPAKREQCVPLTDVFSFAFSQTDKTGHLLMLNLYIRNMLYGIVLCDIPYEIFAYYESLNYQISSAVRIIRLLEENEETKKKLNESLELLTKHNIQLDSISKSDELTGILNRRGFLSEAEVMLEEYRGNPENAPKYILVGYADADGLKGVNDTFGHEEGDALIIATADVLKNTFRKRGIVGRMGGDEFAALAPVDDDEERIRIEEEMKKRVEDYNASSGKPYKFSVSFGTFMFPYTEELKILGMLESADKKMYQIKQTHRAGRRRGDLPT